MLVGHRGAPLDRRLLLGVAAYLQARIPPGHVAFTDDHPRHGCSFAPGFLGTEATFKLLTIGEPSTTASFFGVIVLAAQLGIGILIASLLFRKRKSRATAVAAARA